MAEQGTKPYRFTIRVTVVSIFVFATLCTALIAIGLQYYFSERLATESALKLYNSSARSTSEHLAYLDRSIINTTKLLASFSSLETDEGLSAEALSIFSKLMQTSPFICAIYIGLDDGDLYELINLNTNAAVREQLSAGHLDRWALIKIHTHASGERRREIAYFDAEFNLRVSHFDVSDYDATNRPWYINATDKEVYKTEPYLFQTLQAPGLTYSIKLPGNGTVLGVDIALSSLEEHLVLQGQTHGLDGEQEVFVYKATGELIASNQAAENEFKLPAGPQLTLTDEQKAFITRSPVLRASNETDWPPIDFAIAGEPQGYSIDMLNLVAAMTGLQIEYSNGISWAELFEQFKRGELDLLHSVLNNEQNENLGLFSQPFLPLPFAIVTRPNHQVFSRIEQLEGHKLAIPRGWSVIPIIQRYFPQIEVVEYDSTLAVLQAVAQGEVFAALDNSVVLHYTAKLFFIDGVQFHEDIDFAPANVNPGLSIVVHPSDEVLLEIINLALANITSEQVSALEQKWFGDGMEASSNLQQGAVPYKLLIDIANNPSEQQQLKLYSINGEERYVYVAPMHNSRTETEYFAIVVPKLVLLSTSQERVKKSIMITGICMLLVLPLSWLFASPIINPIKQLALENLKVKNRQYSEVAKVNCYIVEIDELADSMVDMSDSIRQHEQNQKQLMESFIKLIAQAIDDKSPYTAGHCNRVPELGLMLADQAVASQQPPFDTFEFNNEEEHTEFRMAAWLHDCGKITTPEHIVDKGSKLEVIYNRIHEVRMRFEVLWRDAQISYHQQLAQQPENREQLQAELAQKWQTLNQDFEFIANANVGGEFMEQAHIDRLQQLAKITWVRHFDDRLGLSPIEELNYPKSPEVLPVTESLLSDKPQHIIRRDFPVHFDKKFGIKMTVPEHLYNQGELYNLAISRGTLTAEDRFKINEHITSTIKMLESLPFPPELARVPRYASTHHETLKGTGYPRKLTAEQLSTPERILVLADIFEALTAADRPYKKAKPISVAIDILHKMVLDDHVDRDLFELFLTSGVYLDYANKFLDPSQIDTVDIEQYLNRTA
ncbi:HD domain-containing phosphohydrolase [Shewanella algidipiscicola]|uniref:HD-GYP domain-containing protein n=1 Tax=Shewanella algidipiscicola TaxID=614070 RepID=A0ABQ4PH28_9GAMM|nr:HD domain-containing phosphohydrolase [Shewanella algidipiscicola]GIU46870.1 hypothetical protein TUM4630_18700 [Shewanella algidipiscicola]